MKKNLVTVILSSVFLVVAFSNSTYQAEAAHPNISSYYNTNGIVKGDKIDINNYLSKYLPSKEKPLTIEEDFDSNKLGIQNILFTTSDSKGNIKIKSLNLTIWNPPLTWDGTSSGGEDTPPQIHGVKSKAFEKGEWYGPSVEAITATDEEDGDLTDKIIIKGLDAFDEFTDGAYPVTFEVTDSFGNTTSQNVIYYVGY